MLIFVDETRTYNGIMCEINKESRNLSSHLPAVMVIDWQVAVTGLGRAGRATRNQSTGRQRTCYQMRAAVVNWIREYWQGGLIETSPRPSLPRKSRLETQNGSWVLSIRPASDVWQGIDTEAASCYYRFLITKITNSQRRLLLQISIDYWLLS